MGSIELHPVFNCLLSAFPYIALNKLALKMYRPHVCMGIYFSTCISAGLQGSSGPDLLLFHEGTSPASLGYHLLYVAVSGGPTLISDMNHLLGSTPVSGSCPDLSCCQALQGPRKLTTVIQTKAKPSLCHKLLFFISVLKVAGSVC